MKEKKSEYVYAFVGIAIGLSFGIITSIFMYKDAESCHELMEENKLLKDMLYYRETNPMDSP
jgi:ABC-type Fe3+-siderophore transport system permease subunit